MTNSTICFDRVNPRDVLLARQIAQRACKIVAGIKSQRPELTALCPDAMLLEMDVLTVHLIRPLRLLEWLQADLMSFWHDILILETNIDRVTGQFPFYARIVYAQQ